MTTNAATVTQTQICARCSSELVPGRVVFYHVVVEATADATPVIDPNLTEAKISQQLDCLFEQLQETPASEAMDQVHRRLKFCLCVACYRKWIESPAG